MPFTGSHPAAVLLLLRWELVPSALVIGSMAPDFPKYLPLSPGSRDHLSHLSHSLGAVPVLDLGLGLIGFLVWQVLIVPLAVAAAPVGIRARLAPDLPVPWRRHFCGVRSVVLLVLSLCVGAATHVLWDSFTHQGGWGARLLHVPGNTYGPLDSYAWVQVICSLLGAVLVGDAIRRWWRTTPAADPDRFPQPVPALAPRLIAVIRATVLAAGLAGALGGTVFGLWSGQGLHGAGYFATVLGGALGLLALLLVALIHAVRTRSRRFGSAQQAQG